MDSPFKIEKGIPQVPRANTLYPFKAMEVGDSFALPSTRKSRVGAAAVAFSRGGSVRFSIRKHGDGHRCWRVA